MKRFVILESNIEEIREGCKKARVHTLFRAGVEFAIKEIISASAIQETEQCKIFEDNFLKTRFNFTRRESPPLIIEEKSDSFIKNWLKSNIEWFLINRGWRYKQL